MTEALFSRSEKKCEKETRELTSNGLVQIHRFCTYLHFYFSIMEEAKRFFFIVEDKTII